MHDNFEFQNETSMFFENSVDEVNDRIDHCADLHFNIKDTIFDGVDTWFPIK